jgi:hypothetical protein
MAPEVQETPKLSDARKKKRESVLQQMPEARRKKLEARIKKVRAMSKEDRIAFREERRKQRSQIREHVSEPIAQPVLRDVSVAEVSLKQAVCANSKCPNLILFMEGRGGTVVLVKGAAEDKAEPSELRAVVCNRCGTSFTIPAP